MIEGYAGLFQPPYARPVRVEARYSSFSELEQNASIYCITSDDLKSIIMIPLVPGFFETAYSIAKEAKYQNIYMIMPSLDMIFISDAYRFYYEIHVVLHKNVQYICHDRFQILVTDQFYNAVHDLGYENSYQIGAFVPNRSNMNLAATVSFPNAAPTQNRNATDILISYGADATKMKTVYFAISITDKKVDLLTEDIDRYDEIHMPFIKNIYGGMRYFDARKAGNSLFANKLYAYGFQSREEMQLLANTGGKCKEVVYFDLV